MSFYKKTKKAATVALLCVAMLSSFGAPAEAQSTATQQEQIKNLIALIQQLQARLAQMQGSSGPANGCLVLSRSLYLGVSDGETAGEVSKLQQFLTKTGHYTYGKPTGYFGPATQTAVQAWQKANNVVLSGSPETTGFGVTGPSTRSALARSCTNIDMPTNKPENNDVSSKITPPVADAGMNQTIYLPTNSVSPEDQSVENSEKTTVTYLWSLRERDEDAAVPVITNAKTLTPTFSSLSAGDYVFRLTVTDNLGRTDTDDMKVTVKSALNPPVANAGTDRTIYLPTNSVSPEDQSVENSEETTVTYAWTLRERDEDATVPVITNDKTLTPTFSSLSAGQYVFRLTVTDNLGRTDTDDMKVTVK